MHSISANACDLVLSGCPLSVLKYREKGYEAHWMHYEFGNINNNVDEKKEFDVLFFGAITPARKEVLDYIVKEGINLKNNRDKKEIDVLFFGHLTPDRKEMLDYIVKEGIPVKNVGHEDHIEGLPEDVLKKLISKSKIVLNLSKTRTTVVQNYASEGIYEFYYQLKGRIFLAGFQGAACVSEYSPGQELLFSEEEVPTFFTKEECVKILKKLLNNNELLAKYTNKFTSKVCDLFEEKKSFEPIYNAIEKSNHRKVELIKIPYWYLRISAKQILLRNLKLSSLIKAIFQFRIIFEIIKNSSFLTKFLIVFESIINTLWYSFTFTLKLKK